MHDFGLNNFQRIGDHKSTSTICYDGLKRPIEKKDALGNRTSIRYEESKNLRKIVTNPKGVVTTSVLDPYEREIERIVHNPNKDILSHYQKDYDPVGNLVRHHDFIYQKGIATGQQTTSYTYTPMNKVRTVTRASGTPVARTTEYSYDRDGRIARKVKPDGTSLFYSYDALGNLTKLCSSDELLSHSFKYNRLGYLVHAKDEIANTSVSREVDAVGNVLRERFPSGFTVTKEYDLYNRPLAVKYGTHWQVTYGYDPRNLQQAAFQGSDGRVYTHRYTQYDACGRPLQEQLIANLGTCEHAYDLKGRQTFLKTPFIEQTCVYDEEDNLVNSLLDEACTKYGYDELSQLTAEVNHHTNAAYENDSNYNRVAIQEQPCGHNEINELLSTPPDIACRYDLNGNLVEKGSTAYSYDPLNRLISATVETTKIEFQYDPLGRRLKKTSFSATEEGWQVLDSEEYLYDGDHDVGALDRDGNLKQRRILSFLGNQSVPKTLAIEIAGKTFACRSDAHRNIRGLIDPDTKTVASTYDYTAFGKERRIKLLNAYQSPWRYANKRFDSDLGLINFGKRDYNPGLGRWTTTDPAGFVDGTNLYAYVFNNPFRYVDPDGRFVIAWPICVWGGAAGLTWLTPSLTYMLASALTYFIFEQACIAYDRYEYNAMLREIEFPGTPDDLANNPDWKETTHEEGRKRGHRSFENTKTGQKIGFDKGKPEEDGHKAEDHYHVFNPSSRNDRDKYLDKNGDPCGKGSDKSHLYPPEGINWGTNFYD